MTTPTVEDTQAVHRRFSAHCFNHTWTLMESLGSAPTPSEVDALILTAQASLYHWTKREDCTAKHLSVGTWLLARVYAQVERYEEALYWANRALEHAEMAAEGPFYVGYAYEAIARALLKSDPPAAQKALEKAEACVEDIEIEDYREQLAADLRGLRKP